MVIYYTKKNLKNHFSEIKAKLYLILDTMLLLNSRNALVYLKCNKQQKKASHYGIVTLCLLTENYLKMVVTPRLLVAFYCY